MTNLIKNRIGLNTAWVLTYREWMAGLRSPVTYIVAVLASIIQIQIIAAQLNFLNDHGLFISQDPLVPAFLSAISIVVLYAAITSAMSIVSEREGRTLIVLFYTPIDFPSLVLGKFLAHLLISLSILLMAFVNLIITSWFIGFPPELNLLWALLLGVMLLLAMSAFGLTVSSFTQTVRGAILLLFTAFIFLFGLQITGRMLDQFISLDNQSLLIYLTPILNTMISITSLFSPIAYLFRGLEAVALASLEDYLISIISSLLLSVVYLFITARLLRWRGVIV